MIEQLLRSYCFFIRHCVRIIGRTVPILMPILAGLVAFEVFARYVLGAPTIWVYDTSLFLFGYISALGGAYAQQKKSHINVDILYLKVPKIVRAIFNLITIILAVGFLILLAKMSFEKFTESLQFHYRTKSEWSPQVYHFWLMMTVSAVIFIAQYSVEFLENLFYLCTGKKLLPEAQLQLAAKNRKHPLVRILEIVQLKKWAASTNKFFKSGYKGNQQHQYLDAEVVLDKHQELGS